MSERQNEDVAQLLDRIADLLEAQDANPHRVRAYRSGADSVRATDKSLVELSEARDIDEIKQIPNIGQGLASTIMEFVNTGRSSLLDRLEGELSPQDLFAQVPGIGPELARRIAAELDINTLEELEQAAHDGRLEKVEGFGPKRVESVRISLAGLLSRAAQRRSRQAASDKGEAEAEEEQPGVDLLLEVDAEYRRKAEAGELRKIAPRRFNPEGEAWLPIMETTRRDWSFTVLFSNTARAHELDTVYDWVVIYYNPQEGGEEDQVTVVSETHGPMEGKRVVRGREAECRAYYESKS